MKRCYIAGKIGAHPLDIVDAKFEAAEAQVKAMGYEPMSPRKLPHNHDKTWESYMKEDVRLLLTCDAVFALHDWRDSPGATIEVNLAYQFKMEVIQQDEQLLTEEMLSLIPAGQIFAVGIALNEQMGLYMSSEEENHMRELGWVAKKGHGPNDWAIYTHWADKGLSFIVSNGDKVTSERNIENLLRCSAAAMKLYRS